MNRQLSKTLTVISAVVVLGLVAAPAATAAATDQRPPIEYAEREAATVVGSNDLWWTGERLWALGADRRNNPRAQVGGTLADLRQAPVAIPAGAEDNGSIPLATASGIGAGGRRAISTTGRLGDGPHGSTGTGNNDFDVYALTGTKGHTLRIGTEGTHILTDTVVAVYDAAGRLLGSDDDGGAGALNSLLVLDLPADGTYYVLVAGHASAGSLPADPFDSGSGLRGGDVGNYALQLSTTRHDVDVYRVDLERGQVLDAGVTGAAGRLTVQQYGRELATSGPDGTVSYVAPADGWYEVSVRDGFGAYTTALEVRRAQD